MVFFERDRLSTRLLLQGSTSLRGILNRAIIRHAIGQFSWVNSESSSRSAAAFPCIISMDFWTWSLQFRLATLSHSTPCGCQTNRYRDIYRSHFSRDHDDTWWYPREQV